MEMTFVRVLLHILLIQRKLWLTFCSVRYSCYTFHNTKKTWSDGNEDCKTRNGTLVSLETEEEWGFIKKEIQKKDISKNEWFIGLNISKKEFQRHTTLENKRKADWRWTSGERLRIYNKWQPTEPNNKGNYHFFCIVMAKNYPPGTFGLFKDVHCDIRYPYICEYHEGNKVSPVCWSNSSSSLLTTSSQATIPPTTTALVNSQTLASTIFSTMKLSSQTLAGGRDLYIVYIIIIVLAVMLVVFIGFLAAACCWMRKKIGKRSIEERSSLALATQSTTLVNRINNLDHTDPGQAADTTIYADINDKVTSIPLPTNAYYDVQTYIVPVDSPTASTPSAYFYSNTNDSKKQCNAYVAAPEENTTQGTNTYEDMQVNCQTPNAAAMYAVVDKSKKSKKNDGSGMKTSDSSSLQTEPNTGAINNEMVQYSTSSSGVTAEYAVVDKSKKSKNKAGVGMTTIDISSCQTEPNTGAINNEIVHNSLAGVTAEYAIVDKSKKRKNQAEVGTKTPESSHQPDMYADVKFKKIKEKTAEVAIATVTSMGQNKSFDYPNEEFSNPEESHLYAAVDNSENSTENMTGIDKVTEDNGCSSYVHCSDKHQLHVYDEVDRSSSNKDANEQREFEAMYAQVNKRTL